jgi:hypothetical protein
VEPGGHDGLALLLPKDVIDQLVEHPLMHRYNFLTP